MAASLRLRGSSAYLGRSHSRVLRLCVINLLDAIVKSFWSHGECTLNSQEEDFQALIRRVVEESGISQAQLARDAGLSYAALRAWIIGARTPRTESLIQLAAGLEGRSDALRGLAKQFRRAAEQ